MIQRVFFCTTGLRVSRGDARQHPLELLEVRKLGAGLGAGLGAEPRTDGAEGSPGRAVRRRGDERDALTVMKRPLTDASGDGQRGGVTRVPSSSASRTRLLVRLFLH
ncbi:hypothetical protein EYF80_051259 [Liparis tanakae]|uniref:Uncharacterized protein n=1 Tax=Liparis tanakae TaxID=230148 RepID=A0A4Z2FBD8_9TELE|nr:hypothetical protein EYF80_051259 [Liparis tanakae]